MRLEFPNGEHEAVELDDGEAGIGSAAGNRVRIPAAGLAAQHLRLVRDRRGLWMRVAGDVGPVHLNARPVRSLALLRAGDLLCVGHLHVKVCGAVEDAPPSGGPAPGGLAASKVVLRGVAGPHSGRSIPVGDGLALGSASDAGLHLSDPALQGTSVELSLVEGGAWLVVQAGDEVEVNGRPCRRALLRHGDQLCIDPHRFVLEAPGLRLRARKQADGPQTGGGDAPAAGVAVPADNATTVWWLIAAAAVLAAVITGLLLYGPGGT